MQNNNNLFNEEEIKLVISNYIYNPVDHKDPVKKNFVLFYIKKAVEENNREFIDFILKTFICNNASIEDFNNNGVENALDVICDYIESDFSILSAMKLNQLKIPYYPKIDFTGVRYEGFESDTSSNFQNIR